VPTAVPSETPTTTPPSLATGFFEGLSINLNLEDQKVITDRTFRIIQEKVHIHIFIGSGAFFMSFC
jgi:hypothetical protein